MELTREKIENLAKYDSVYDGEQLYMGETVAKIAKQLLAEMDKPGVWDNAPNDAIIAKVHFYKRDKVYARSDGTPEVYTRELPKSPERKIAEKWAATQEDADAIEAAINEYKALSK